MKKFLWCMFLIIFVTIGFTEQSWAMGMFKKKRSRGQGYHSQGTSTWTNNSENPGSDDYSELYDELQTQTWHTGQNSNNYSNNSPQDSGDHNLLSFPDGYISTTGTLSQETNLIGNNTIPEPMTLSLMGMGLAGIFLKRRKLRLPR